MLIKEKILRSSSRRALDVIGDRWTLLVVLGAFYGFGRFDDWLQHYRMSSSVLSDRLKRLQRKRILAKEPINDSLRSRYVLTESGRDLFGWALAVWVWEDTWLYSDNGHPVPLFHTTCGKHTKPSYACEHCGEAVRWSDVRVEEGPGIHSREVATTPNSRRSTAGADAGKGHDFGRIIDIFGDRWSHLIVSASVYRVRRFDDFLRELDIAPSILSDRLKRLVDHGLLARSCYQERPARWEYILTEKTTDYIMVPMMLGIWGDTWLPLAAGPPILRSHTLCGHSLQVKMNCAECGVELKQDEVSFHDTHAHPTAKGARGPS